MKPQTKANIIILIVIGIFLFSVFILPSLTAQPPVSGFHFGGGTTNGLGGAGR